MVESIEQISKFLIFLNLSGKINAAEIPRVNLDEAERYFNNACVHFMRRDYREAQMYLDQAIHANTYMVDYYLLSAVKQCYPTWNPPKLYDLEQLIK